MKKQHLYILAIVLLVMVTGFNIFYYLESEKPQRDERALPKRVPVDLGSDKEVLKVPEKKPELKLKVQEKSSLEPQIKEEVKVEIKKPSPMQEEIANHQVIEIEPVVIEVVEPYIIKREEPLRDIEEEIQNQLQGEIARVYAYCQNLERSKKSVSGLKKALKNYKTKTEGINVFLADYQEHTLFGENSQEDLDARTIVLEQIQKVRKNEEGFIVSRVGYDGLKRYIAVRNLDIGNLYIGVDKYQNDVQY